MALCSKNPKKCLELMDMDPLSCPVSKLPNEFCLDPESPSIGGDKPEPWWRTDKDELASLVLEKSHNHIKNCDLPPPQKMYNIRTDPYAHLRCLDRDEAIASSFGLEARTGGIPNRSRAQGCPDSGKPHGYQGASFKEGCSRYGSDKSFSYSRNHEDTQVSESAHGKAQLKKALCHSQTRARESETIAKQIYAEKEHILKLLFRQASQLFAYKLWFQLLLLLETLYIHIDKNEGSISTLFPVFLPYMPYKCEIERESRLRAIRGRRLNDQRARNNNIAKYAVAFALGLSIVSAGLLIMGWTLGRMLPPPF